MTTATDLLVQFCDTVDATGGATYDKAGVPTLVGDDWPDMADVYLEACKLLGREPTWTE